VAVLGTAHPHLADHLRAIADHAEVAAVHPGRWRPVSPRQDPAAAVADADAAVICSTTAEHAELLAVSTRAGLPTLVEKPLATGPAEALALARAAGGTAVSVAMFLRCAAVLRRARDLLAAGALGELVAADAWFTHAGLLDGLFDGPAAWMLDPAWGPVGAMADLGVHLVDLLRWLRPHAPLRVRSTVLRRLPHGLPGDAGGTALLDWGGVPAALHTAWDCPAGGVRLRLAGTAAVLRTDGGRLLLTGRRERPAEAHGAPDAADASASFLAALCHGPGHPLPGADDAAVCARLMEEVLDAARWTSVG
jgi:predicted dehydrogenase